MATARELLEQADALMRKNRERVADIPLLVDAVASPDVRDANHDAASVAASSARTGAIAGAARSAIDIPVLTDIVAAPAAVVAIAEKAPIVMPGFEGDPSNWLVMDTIDPLNSITGEPPDTLSVLPIYSSKAAGSAPTPPPARSTPADTRSASAPAESRRSAEQDLAFVWEDPPSDEGVPPESAAAIRSRHTDAEHSLAEPPTSSESHAPYAEDESARDLAAVEAATEPASTAEASATTVTASDAAIADEDARWQALSEQISMQVLQRVDLFTDEGLRDQLAGRLHPIMTRASAELVNTITSHVGQLLRTYVAEAIEREIAAWRRDQP